MKLLLVLMMSLFQLSPALAQSGSKHKSMKKKMGTAASTVQVMFTNILADGKKVWLPKEMTLIPGKYEFVLRNNLDAAHGFEIKGMTKGPIVVPANNTKLVKVTAKKGSYDIKCHMHPAHLGAKLVVK